MPLDRRQGRGHVFSGQSVAEGLQPGNQVVADDQIAAVQELRAVKRIRFGGAFGPALGAGGDDSHERRLPLCRRPEGGAEGGDQRERNPA